MVSTYRCSHGHNWSAPPGGAVGACPVCGNTVARATDPTPVDDLTHTHVIPPPSPVDPSFASLAGEVPAPDPSAVTCDPAPPKGGDDGDPLTSEFRPSPVPGYEILHELGRGGMGVVYKARQVDLNRTVALKMVLAGSHAGPTDRERFRREAHAVAALQHPLIVQIFEIGDANGHPYLALEFVDGGSLAQHLTGQPWPARDAAELVDLLARAVHYAHSQGVVHRDLKPGNVLLSAERGTRNAEPKTGPTGADGLHSALRTPRSALPKITDFGLAKRLDETVGVDGGTKTGAVMGTPSYIAPEQAAGRVREIGPGVDVYALGAILYELLTGRPPFRGETPLDTVLQVLNDDPVSPKSLQPTVPWDLQTICLRSLTKNPAKRYPSAVALADDLRRFLNGEPILARPLSAWGRGVKWARRHPVWTTLAAATVTATVALVAVLSVAYARVRDAGEQKELEATAARTAREHETTERLRAERLAAENEKARAEAVDQADQLKREAERSRRIAYALQLAQIAVLSDRDPRRARTLLDDPGRCPPELRDFAWAYLRRLSRREDRVYADHPKDDALYAVAVAPGGTFVATAGRDGRVRVWDPRTGRTWAVLAGHHGRVLGLAFSPDGGVLATAGADHTVRLWEFPADMLDMARRAMNTLTFLQPFVGPFQLRPAVTLADTNRNEATCVGFSPDGRTLAAGLGDGTLKLWDVGGWRPNALDAAVAGGPAAVGLAAVRARGPHPRVWPGRAVAAHNGAVRCLAFAESGRLATGGDDKTVRVWATSEPLPVRVIDGHADAVLAVAFTPDGRLLLSANNGSTPSIRLIDLDARADERRLIGHTGAIYALAVSPDGQVVASGGFDRTVRLWDLDERKERAVLLGHEQGVRGVAFGTDRKGVVSAGADATARVWQTVVRPNETADVTTPRDGLLTGAATDGTGATFILADGTGRVSVRLADLFASRANLHPGQLQLWPVPVEVPARASVRAVAAAPDGRVVIGATPDALLLWRIFQFRPRGREAPGMFPLPVAKPSRLPTPKSVYAIALSPTGKTAATLDADGVRVWELPDFPFVHDSTPAARPPVAIVPTSDARDLVFFPRGDRLAVALGTGVRVVDLSGKVLADLPDAHPARVEAVAVDPGGELVATADAGGLIKVWRVRPDGGLVHQADLAGHTDAVYTLGFTLGGRTLASGGADRTVVLWDPLTGQERLVLTGHADRLVRVQFTADGNGLVTIDRDGEVKRWRAEPRDPPRLPGGPGPRR